MAHYLVTGGCGFIGCHLVKTLVERRERVRVFDNCTTGKAENIADVADKIEFCSADLQDIDAVSQAVEGIDYVFHQGALSSVPRSVADPIATNNVNINGTLNLLVASRDAGVKRVVYAASSSAYGNRPTPIKSEDLPPDPASPYALTKYVGERYCQIFTQLYGLETVALRYFNIFGPYQDSSSSYSAVIPLFISAYLNGEAPKIEGDGEQSRDFTYVANAVHANLLACHTEGVAGEVFNVGCGERTSINQIATFVGEMMESDTKPIHVAPRPGDVRHSLADIQKAKRLLGYEPQIDIKTGLRRTIDWFLQ